MSAINPFRKLPFALTLTVLVSGFVSLELRYAYNFSVANALVVWIGTVIFCGLVMVAAAYILIALDKWEKELQQATREND